MHLPPRGGGIDLALKILDLFCGIGGAALGIKRVLREFDVNYFYVAVDLDRSVLKAHRIINPDSHLIRADAYSLPDEFLMKFDFIWASPPCETHSVLRFRRRRNQRKDRPDVRLWDLIRRLRRLGIPHIVENVKPFYGFVLKPTITAWRHCFWSNIPLSSPSINFGRWYEIHNSKRKLLDFLGLPRRCWNFVTREMLRDCTHPEIAYSLFKQWIIFSSAKQEVARKCACPVGSAAF